MIELRVLGTIDLQGGMPAETSRILAQPKRLALLAFLAAATPYGFHRRDRLLALFWPEYDTERARHALRQAVHFLRRALGEGVIVRRGDGELGVDRALLWCDAAAFDEAAGSGRSAEALELYRGELLPGFHVSGGAELEHWLAAERTRLQARAVSLAWDAADAAEAQGELETAASWGRRAVDLAPDDEEAVRRLIELHARGGDHAGALSAYRKLAQYLEREYEAAPSAATQALIERVRACATPSIEPASEPASLVEQQVDVTAPPVDATAAPPRPLPPARGALSVRAVAIAAVVLILLTAIATPVIGWRGEHPAGRDEMAALGRPTTGLASVSTTSRVAYRFYEEGLREYDAGNRPRASHLFQTALAEDSTFAMAAHLAALTSEFPESHAWQQRALRLASRATERERLFITAEWAAGADDPRRLALAETLAVRYPAEAAGQHLLGQALLWSGDFLGAVERLRRAIALDSTALSGASAGCRACDAYWDLASAYTYADSLAAAERVAREWARAQPRSARPWIVLGFTLDAAGRYAEAIAAVDSATVRQPGDPGLDVRTGVMLRSGDFDAFEQLTRGLLRVSGPEVKKQVLWLLALALRTQGRMTEALAVSRQLTRLATEPSASPATATLNRVAEAQALFDAGAVREAATLFEAIAGVDITTGSEARNARHRAWNLTHAADASALLGDTARLRILADSIEQLGARSAYARDQRLHHHIRGLLLRAQGRHAEAADEFRRALFSLTTGNTRTYKELARALIHARRPAEAVPVLEAALRGPVGGNGYYVTHTELHELLARALREAGRATEATAHDRWVAAAWKHGDVEFRRRAEEARRRVGGV